MPTDEDISRIQGAHELGLAFVRSVILLNGGAFAILMSYMAASDTNSLVGFSVVGLKMAMLCFLAGIVSVLMTLITSYLYTALNFQSPLRQWLDTKIIGSNVILCVLALLAFVFGVVTLVSTVELRVQ
jgi:hypothetical protein